MVINETLYDVYVGNIVFLFVCVCVCVCLCVCVCVFPHFPGHNSYTINQTWCTGSIKRQMSYENPIGAEWLSLKKLSHL